MVGHRLFISFYLPKEEFERLSSRSSFFSSVVSSKLVTVSTFSEMFESSCFFRCPVRDRPFNLKGGGLWFFVSFRIFFSDNTRVRIFIFFVAILISAVRSWPQKLDCRRNYRLYSTFVFIHHDVTKKWFSWLISTAICHNMVGFTK